MGSNDNTATGSGSIWQAAVASDLNVNLPAIRASGIFGKASSTGSGVRHACPAALLVSRWTAVCLEEK